MSTKHIHQCPSQATAEEPTLAPNHCVRARDGYQTPAVRRAELTLGPTGPFRPLIERYMATVAANHYKPEGLVRVRGNLGKFFRFLVQDLGIEDLDKVRPSTITRFIERERKHGLSNHNFLGHLASFFVWVISLETYDQGNPVINRLHRRQMTTGVDPSTSARSAN